MKQAEGDIKEEGDTVCCYAKSEKSWMKTPRVFHGKCFTPMVKRSSMAVVKTPKKHPNQWTIGRITKKQIAVVGPNNPKQ